MKTDVYRICPIYQGKKITLRQTVLADAVGLLSCYSDVKAVPLFNSDNCHGDTFYYRDLAAMEKAIEFWEQCYQKRDFVRWTIIDRSSEAIIGTIEMFHRLAADEFNHFGVLRIDLQSDYEKQEYIEDILVVANEHFYSDFAVEHILTKAIPAAVGRILALQNQGYAPLKRQFMIYKDYFVRNIGAETTKK